MTNAIISKRDKQIFQTEIIFPLTKTKTKNERNNTKAAAKTGMHLNLLALLISVFILLFSDSERNSGSTLVSGSFLVLSSSCSDREKRPHNISTIETMIYILLSILHKKM